MRKLFILSLVALAAAALTAASSAAPAKRGPQVLRSGKCSGSSTWKLKLKNDDGRLETEFEVDQNVVGKRWNVVLKRNGIVVFRGVKVTRGPSGSFEARKLLGNSPGRDRVVATARALAGGEVCRGAATL
jgi:hypothetical protein